MIRVEQRLLSRLLQTSHQRRNIIQEFIMGSVVGKIGEEMPRYNSEGGFAPNDDGLLAFEVRRYEPAVAVQTAMPHQTESNAFNLLARYIGVIGTAQNDRKEGISMTAPVVNTMDMDDNNNPMTDMQFVFPQSLYGDDVSSAPPPTADGVQLVRREEKTMGVHTFSGNAKEKELTEKVKELAATLEKMEGDTAFGWKVKKPLVSESYRYNPPWTLPFMKTNEVAVELEAKQVKAPEAQVEAVSEAPEAVAPETPVEAEASAEAAPVAEPAPVEAPSSQPAPAADSTPAEAAPASEDAAPVASTAEASATEDASPPAAQEASAATSAPGQT